MNTLIYRTVARLEGLRSRPLLGQLLAVLLCVAAIVTRLLIGDVLTGFPFLTFFPAVTLSAFLGGRAAGVTAAILGGLLAKYFLIEPLYSFELIWPLGWIAMAFYVLTVTIIVGLIHTLFVTLQAQREGESHLQLALSAGGGVGTWDLDIGSGLVVSDERFARLYGVDPARASKGAAMAEFFAHMHDGDRARVQAAVEKAIASGEEFLQDYRLVQPNGEVRWVSAVGRCTYNSEAKPVRFPGVSFDITARKNAEEKLRLLNIDLERQVVERSSERGTTWNLSPHLLSVLNLETACFSRVNPAWTATLGWSEDELVGKPFYDFLHPDDAPASRGAWEQVRHGEAVQNFENRFRTKDGDIRVLSWVAVREEGLLYSTARDITAERALRDSEGQFRTMAQAMPHHVWTAPANGLLDWFNERVYEYSGKARGALDGTGWTAIVHPGDLPEAGSRWSAALAAGKVYEAEFRLQGADGSYRWHIARAVPIKDEAGNVARWIGTNTDIEEHKRADEQRMLVLNELNHRVKNLFALVGGLVTLSARGVTTARELAGALQGRLLALSRAHELIQPGLRSDHAAALSGVELSALIGQIFSPYSASRHDRSIEIQGPKITLSSGAVTSMALIFHELATNAAKYGALREAGGGSLKVTWDIADGTMKLNWLESGCLPRESEPGHTGFGSVLLRRSIEGQFGGAMIHVWNPDGLAIAISAPVSRFSEA